MHFEHETLGQRVFFGSGRVFDHLASEIAHLGSKKALLIASRRDGQLIKQLTTLLPDSIHIDEVKQHVPMENVKRARTLATEAKVDLLVAVGGGSAIGLAKAIALSTGSPIIAVPTTLSGSEATHMWGITESRHKRTGLDVKTLPTTVIYDAELTQSLPLELLMSSGLNALAHAVDSLWAPKSDPINQVHALEGVQVVARTLQEISDNGPGLAAREQLFYGSYLSAVAFASAGSGLHHKICHVLGGEFDLPHAQTHAVVLPYVVALNAPATPNLARRLATALNVRPEVYDDAAKTVVDALNTLRVSVKAPVKLSDIGFTSQGIPTVVPRILEVVPTSNPVRVNEANLTNLLEQATVGDTSIRPLETTHPITT